MKSAAYVGTFDPLTNGHLWVIEQASNIFDKVFIAIGTNPEKKPTFSLEERAELIRQSTSHLNDGRIVIGAFPNRYQVDYANSVGAGYIVRGIRNQKDYEFERDIRHVNSDVRNGITTVYLMPPRELSEVSSSMVKGLVGPEGWENVVSKYVPTPVFHKLKERHGTKR